MIRWTLVQPHGSLVATLPAGRLALGQGDSTHPPGDNPSHREQAWARLVGGSEWPFQGWFRVPGTTEAWRLALQRDGGEIPDALALLYWRAYSQVLEAELAEHRAVPGPTGEDW